MLLFLFFAFPLLSKRLTDFQPLVKTFYSVHRLAIHHQLINTILPAVTAVIKMEENDPDMHIHSSILDEEQDMQTKEKVLAQVETHKPILDEYRRKYSID